MVAQGYYWHIYHLNKALFFGPIIISSKVKTKNKKFTNSFFLMKLFFCWHLFVVCCLFYVANMNDAKLYNVGALFFFYIAVFFYFLPFTRADLTGVAWRGNRDRRSHAGRGRYGRDLLRGRRYQLRRTIYMIRFRVKAIQVNAIVIIILIAGAASALVGSRAVQRRRQRGQMRRHWVCVRVVTAAADYYYYY